MKASMEERTVILVSSEKDFFELASILLKEGYYFKRNKEQFLNTYFNTYHNTYHNKTTDFKMLIYSKIGYSFLSTPVSTIRLSSSG